MPTSDRQREIRVRTGWRRHILRCCVRVHRDIVVPLSASPTLAPGNGWLVALLFWPKLKVGLHFGQPVELMASRRDRLLAEANLLINVREHARLWHPTIGMVQLIEGGCWTFFFNGPTPAHVLSPMHMCAQPHPSLGSARADLAVPPAEGHKRGRPIRERIDLDRGGR